MSVMQAIILGIVQGFSEFLPISSSGHLIILPKIFAWADQGLAYDAIMHLATALAVVIALRKEIRQVLSGFNLKREDSQIKIGRKLIKLIILSVLPAAMAGLLFNGLIEESLRVSEVVAWSLIFWGIILALSEYYNSKLMERKDLEKITYAQALSIGLMQMIALIPGTSRSGITITAGLFAGMKKSAAVKYSFLTGLPLIVMAGLYEFIKIFQVGQMGEEWLVFTSGFLGAFISGLMAIKLLIWLAEKVSFKIFVAYRILLGIGLLLFF